MNHALLDDGYDYCTPHRVSLFQLSAWSSSSSSSTTMVATTQQSLSIEDVLRCLLFVSVSVFLCTALLLQGTLLELGMIRCRRKMERWNTLLARTSRRQTISLE